MGAFSTGYRNFAYIADSGHDGFKINKILFSHLQKLLVEHVMDGLGVERGSISKFAIVATRVAQLRSPRYSGKPWEILLVLLCTKPVPSMQTLTEIHNSDCSWSSGARGALRLGAAPVHHSRCNMDYFVKRFSPHMRHACTSPKVGKLLTGMDCG